MCFQYSIAITWPPRVFVCDSTESREASNYQMSISTTLNLLLFRPRFYYHETFPHTFVFLASGRLSYMVKGFRIFLFLGKNEYINKTIRHL